MTSRPEARAVSAQDLLPTAEAVALAKGLAARACAAKAADAAWPKVEPAVLWVQRIPLVALAVLIELCPEVPQDRLALCLGLLPMGALGELNRWRGFATWSDDLVAGVVQQVRAGP